MTETATKVEWVYAELKGRIARWHRGNKMPSIRNLMREFNVSQITVDRAMDRLSEEGLIVKRPKKGIFVGPVSNQDLSVKKHTIAVAVPNYPSPIYDDYLLHLDREIRTVGELAEVIRYDWRERILQDLPSKKVDGLVLIPTGSRFSPRDFAVLGRFDRPVVLISRVLRDVGIDCVEPDNELGGELAAEHLLGLGHRRLAVLLSEPVGPATDSRIAGFMRRAAQAGVTDVRVINAETRPGENAAWKAYESMKTSVGKEAAFSGLFVLSDGSALGALKALHELKVPVPGQVSVMGFGDIPEAGLFHPALTTIHEDRATVAREAVKILEARMAGKKGEPIHRFIPPTVVCRESTGKPI